MIKLIFCNLIMIATMSASVATELNHDFQSPAFSGNGYGSHVLTIEQLETQRKEKIKDDAKSAEDAEKRAAGQTNLAKFLVNVESRIYAQLSKQLADSMFADSGATNGTLDFQGTQISWVKGATEVTLTITETNGNVTNVTVPVASFGF